MKIDVEEIKTRWFHISLSASEAFRLTDSIGAYLDGVDAEYHNPSKETHNVMETLWILLNDLVQGEKP